MPQCCYYAARSSQREAACSPKVRVASHLSLSLSLPPARIPSLAPPPQVDSRRSPSTSTTPTPRPRPPDCQPCTCSPDATYGGTLLNCSGLALSSVPFPLPPAALANASSVTALDVSGNALTTLQSGLWAELGNLRALDARDNRLQQLSRSDGLPATLQALSVSDNALAAVEVAALAGLASLAMDGNPAQCSLTGGAARPVLCSCGAGYGNVRALGNASVSCLRQCPGHVPAFLGTGPRCEPRRPHVATPTTGDTCAQTCDRAPGAASAHAVTLSCTDSGRWLEAPSDATACAAVTCLETAAADGGALDQGVGSLPVGGCRCNAAGGALATDFVCHGVWPLGLPPRTRSLVIHGVAGNRAITAAVLARMDLAAQVDALPDLATLRLSGLGLEALPVELVAFVRSSGVAHLALDNNRLQAQPDAGVLAEWPALVSLSLQGNQLERLDLRPILAHPLLTTLDVRGNRISELAPRQSDNRQFSALRRLYLADNRISRLHKTFRNMIYLDLLDLSQNQITGVYGPNFPEVSLRQLNLRANRIEIIDRHLPLTIDYASASKNAPFEIRAKTPRGFVGYSSESLHEDVGGVFTEGNPSSCSWNRDSDNDFQFRCSCASGLSSVPLCPRQEMLECGNFFSATRLGNVPEVLPAALCDGKPDCPAGEDEAEDLCAPLEITTVSTVANSFGPCLIARAPGEDCESCFVTLRGQLRNGIYHGEGRTGNAPRACGEACPSGQQVIVSPTRSAGASASTIYR